MKTFKQIDTVYIKSTNTTNKIFNRYLFCLIPYILFITIYNLIWGEIKYTTNLILHTIIALLISTIIELILNTIKKQDNNLVKILIDEKILIISLIIGLFSINSTIISTIICVVITSIVKNIQNKTNISSVLYGILTLIIINYFTNNLNTPLINLTKLSYISDYNSVVKPYGNILTYIFGLKYYLSPILSILAFIYLFYNKSIKYNIVVSYLLTFILTMLSFGLINNMNIWYLFFQITTGNILFLIVFLAPDYSNTPTTGEGQFLYGMILGIITSILRFIIPELSVVISLIIGPLLLTKFINNLSFKLRYKKNIYHLTIIISLFILLITNIVINIVI